VHRSINSMHGLQAALSVDVVDDHRGALPAKSSAMARPQACPAPVTSTTLLVHLGIASTLRVSECASSTLLTARQHQL
jgi:hypothetical protein